MDTSSLTVLTPLDPRRWDAPHMPSDWQTFLLRMYGRVTPETIGEILGAGADEVISAAKELGIAQPPADAAAEAEWREKGYITLIRDSWHLLDLGQICLLTGKSAKELAYTVKEDDFLHVKLGGFKPDLPPLRMTGLSPEQKAKTARVREALKGFYGGAGEPSVRPFDFPAIFRRFSGVRASKGGESVRLAYSYCALYGDTFVSDFDYGFSEEMLSAYEAFGVSGIWCQAVLYRIAPYPFLPELCVGWERRLDGIRKLTERLDRHGLKLYLYLNEPRALPSSYFADGMHDGVKGHSRGALTSLCTSSEPVRRYLYDTAAFLAREVPLLGGFMTISGSENQTHCCSHTTPPDDCPRCSKRSWADVTAECNNLLYRGAASVNPDFNMIAWTWGWPDDLVGEAAARLDPGIILSEVSEHGKEKILGGVKTSVSDYSISVVGPGEHALASWKLAAGYGHRACAKTQLNTSWECSSVPMLPVFDTVAKHLCRLKKAGVEDLILDWTVGGYPSPTFALAKIIMDGEAADEAGALDIFYRSLLPDGCREGVRRGVTELCRAFDSFPFHIGVLYSGPQQMGAATPLRLAPSGMRATMTCWPYDDTDSWRAIYPPDVFEELTKKLSEGWERGMRIILEAAAGQEDGVAADIADCAEAAYCCFRPMYLMTRFNRLRADPEANREELIAIAREEADTVLRLAGVQARNPCVGFESTNHYFFTRESLAEAYVSCMDVISALESK